MRVLGDQSADQPSSSTSLSSKNFSQSFQQQRQQILSSPAKTIGSGEKTEPKTEVEEPKGIFDIAGKSLTASIKNSIGELKSRFRITEQGVTIIKPEEEEKIAKFAVGLAKDILRAGPRAGASIAITARGEKEFVPGTGIAGKAEKILFGDKAIKDIKGTGEETVTSFGGSEQTAQKYGIPAGVAMTALDVWPGGGKGKIAREIADEGSEKVIKGILKTKVFKNMADDAIEGLAKKLAIIGDPKIVQKELDNALEASKPVIERLAGSITKAKPIREAQEKLYTAERARRAAQVEAVANKIGGEKGFVAQLGQLKGELPKVRFESVRKAFSQDEIDSLFDAVQNAHNLFTYEKITTKGALVKLFSGSVPARREIELLSEVFPKTLIDAILKKRSGKEKIFEAIGHAVNLPRSVMATLDLSAPLRQGVFLVGKPKQFLSSFKNMFKYAASQKAYDGLIEGIKLRPTYKMMRGAKLSLTDIGSTLTKREETFMSNLAEKIPGFGSLARASNRAYSGFLNKLRADVFDDIITRTSATGKNLDSKELADVAKFVNAATGRGNLPSVLERAAPALNAAFFSPRLMASRLNLLNPYFYVSLSAPARKEAVKSLFSFAGVAGSVLGLAKLGGAEVGADPRSADFGKIKVGNTRYDILGGFQQYLKLAGQLITGEMVSTTTGRTMTLGEGYGTPTRKDILIRFLESKENPVVSFVTGFLSGENQVGEDFDIPTEVISRFIPMVTQDMYDLSQEKGTAGLMMGLPAIFGTGVQTYGKQELVEGESKIGEPTAQIRPVQELADKIREKVVGKQPLGSSKGFSVETYFDQLSNLPPDEANEIFFKIAEVNEDLARQISDVAKERQKGITVHDKDLKSKGVKSGDRALVLLEEFNKIKTKEEKTKLWNEYARKGVITEEVARQLKILLGKE